MPLWLQMIPAIMAPLDVWLNEEQNSFVHDSAEKNPNARMRYHSPYNWEEVKFQGLTLAHVLGFISQPLQMKCSHS
jgi:hypothetical protein